MLNVMFWNIQRGKASPYLSSACFENNVDILFVAEDPSPPDVTESLINNISHPVPYRSYAPIPSDMRLYTRLPLQEWSLVDDLGSRVSLRLLTQKSGLALTFIAAHFPSKMHAGEDEQYAFSRSVRDVIETAEQRLGHRNSILLGDLNMSPFEKGLVAHDGIHAVMDAQIAKQVSRRFQGKDWSFFYNPMWSRFGDESIGPPGTYFRNSSQVVNFYWHMFDQVIIRPELLAIFPHHKLKIVTKIGTLNLVENNRINPVASDHLPLVFTLDN